MNIHEEFYNDYICLNPIMATHIGDYRFEDKYEHASTSNYEKKLKIIVKKFEEKIKLEQEDIYIKLMKYQLGLMKESLEYESLKYLPVNHLRNPFKEILDSISKTRLNENKISYLNLFKERVGQMIIILNELKNNMLEGIKKNIVENREIILLLIDDLENIKFDTKNIYYKKEYLKFMNSIFKKEAINFATFLKFEYLPYCKNELGLYGLPGSKKLYNFCLKSNINLDINYHKILKIGIDTVNKIDIEIKKLNISQSELRDKKNRYKSTNDVLKDYKNKLKFLENSVLFDKPKNYRSPDIIGFKSKHEPLANYWSPDINGIKNGIFKLNIYNNNFLKSDTLGLTAHEAMPGHGFQLQSIILNKNLPKWIRVSGYTSVIEGWALYCETLYKGSNKLEYYSYLNSRQLRAIRLVVDILIHIYGFNFKQIFKIMKKYLYNPDSEITNEIYRYSALPGQACSYMIGCLCIEEMAKSSTDLKDFHNWFIKHSYLPINLIINLYYKE